MHAWLVDGKESPGVPLDDRGLAYGDGLFETIAVIGGRPRLWQAHMDRLGEGCERLAIDMPPQETLLREAQAVTRKQPHGVVKIILTRGSGERGYAPGRTAATRRLVCAYDFPPGIEEAIKNGVEARVLQLRLALQPVLGGIKHLNRLEQVMAARELESAPGTEGILLDQEGYMIGALSGNLFLVSEGNLLTPRMDRCGVRGVVRAAIINEYKTQCELRRLHPAILADVDEVFLCNAIRGVVPVVRIGSHHWTPGRLTRDLQAWFRRRARAA